MVAAQPKAFDVIVIGSGIGGLTVAVLLAKLQRKRVLVLEQHFTAGGFTHTFERNGQFHWDVGLHYVGGMGQGSMERSVFDYLTCGQLRWQKMPDPFEKFVYPDFTFEVSSDQVQFCRDLIQRFPSEELAIRRYFKDLPKAAFWFGAYGMLDLFPHWLHPLFRSGLRYFGAIARQTTQQYLDQHFQDPQLKALLVSQWGDYGLPPSQSCFGIHALIVSHYSQGGWYPVGGSKAIAQAMIPVIEQAGGAVLTQRKVTEILLDGNQACGVRVQRMATSQSETEIYHAPIVVSDAGALNTYLKLLPRGVVESERAQIKTFPKGNSMVTLYLGLKENPQCLGFQGENHWIYTTYDHEEVAQLLSTEMKEAPKFAYLSFPSLKDPLAKGHTAEIIAHANYEDFCQWQMQPWRRRDADYKALKAQITESLIQLVDCHYPGFKDSIEYAELSSPLTVEHFDASDRGSVYGIPCVPERLDQAWTSAKTPIKNLYLTGADTLSPGIVGAMMGGVKTAGLLNGSFGFFKLMAVMMRESASEAEPPEGLIAEG